MNRAPKASTYQKHERPSRVEKEMRGGGKLQYQNGEWTPERLSGREAVDPWKEMMNATPEPKWRLSAMSQPFQELQMEPSTLDPKTPP